MAPKEQPPVHADAAPVIRPLRPGPPPALQLDIAIDGRGKTYDIPLLGEETLQERCDRIFEQNPQGQTCWVRLINPANGDIAARFRGYEDGAAMPQGLPPLSGPLPDIDGRRYA